MTEPVIVVIDTSLGDFSERVEGLLEDYQLKQGQSIGTFYIMPEQEVIERAARRPQILMMFKQPAKELTENFPRAVDSRISFRLMEKSKENITKQDLEFYAGRIKTLFGGETPFIWERGKGLYTYLDQIKGYRLQVLAPNEQAAKKVMEQVLDVQSHSPDWVECFDTHTSPTPEAKYDDTPGRTTILGKSYKKPRRRPRVTMEFWKAEIFIPGIAGSTLLHDRTGFLYKASMD